MKHYEASWGTSLIVVSTITTLLCMVISVILMTRNGILPWLSLLPMGIVAISAFFTIRGYTITPGAILVHRLIWTTTLPLPGLKSARFDPQAMRRSIRLFGNGGLFSYTGFFRNWTLGVYRAYVTDTRCAVVLEFAARTVVVSPHLPEQFVSELSNA